MKYYKIVTLLLVLIYSCSSIKGKLIPTNNKGGYKLKLVKNKKDSILIYGKVVDVNTEKPLSNTVISIGCNTDITSIDGKYSLKVAVSDLKYFIKVSTIGYKMIKTNSLKLNGETNFKIDFFLEEDDTLLIHCD